jgi:tetratricopeptide (TPR) repeat protein
MRLHRIAPVLLLAVGLGACDDDLLDVKPVDQVDNDIAIVDEASARAALNGAYAALEDLDYYGGDYLMFGDLMTENAEHTGTFAVYADADAGALTADNGVLEGAWDAMYVGINRVNVLIEKVPTLDNISASAADEILGQAYALRALHYHNLVRAWGNVPIVLVPPATVDEASQVTQSTPAQVYIQIHADLDQAETLLAGGSNDMADRIFTTPGFVDALRARVYLYQGDYANAQAAAEAVVSSGDYELADAYPELFESGGAPTSEDIFRVVFTPSVYNNLGYYYQFDGRFELGATQEAFDLYDAGDERAAWTFGAVRSDGIEVTKFPTTVGSENLHVIRYAEVLLILAEALAEQNQLPEAVGYLNDVRTRAGLTAYDLTTDLGDDQQQVLDAVHMERRLELAFEGDRWFDLVRRGVADNVLPNIEPYEMMWPIPLNELDVAPNLSQNAGYAGGS